MSINPALLPTFLVAMLLFVTGILIKKQCPRVAIVLGVILSIPATLGILYYTHLFDNWRWFYEARTLRFSELSFAGIGFLGGTVYEWQQPENWRERAFMPLASAVVLLVPFMKPLLDPLDLSKLQNRCSGPVCLQSTFSTCGPASAATILRTQGQEVTERDLAIDSLTYRGGTEAWYLARALRRRGNNAEFIFSEGDNFPYPAVAGVRLPGGAGHFIALLKTGDGAATIVDPLSGKLTIPMVDLRKRYHFTGFFLKITLAEH